MHQTALFKLKKQKKNLILALSSISVCSLSCSLDKSQNNANELDMQPSVEEFFDSFDKAMSPLGGSKKKIARERLSKSLENISTAEIVENPKIFEKILEEDKDVHTLLSLLLLENGELKKDMTGEVKSDNKEIVSYVLDHIIGEENDRTSPVHNSSRRKNNTLLVKLLASSIKNQELLIKCIERCIKANWANGAGIFISHLKSTSQVAETSVIKLFDLMLESKPSFFSYRSDEKRWQPAMEKVLHSFGEDIFKNHFEDFVEKVYLKSIFNKWHSFTEILTKYIKGSEKKESSSLITKSSTEAFEKIIDEHWYQEIPVTTEFFIERLEVRVAKPKVIKDLIKDCSSAEKYLKKIFGKIDDFDILFKSNSTFDNTNLMEYMVIEKNLPVSLFKEEIEWFVNFFKEEKNLKLELIKIRDNATSKLGKLTTFGKKSISAKLNILNNCIDGIK